MDKSRCTGDGLVHFVSDSGILNGEDESGRETSMRYPRSLVQKKSQPSDLTQLVLPNHAK